MEIPTPKFCPKGCGKTLNSTMITGDELHLISSLHPNWKNYWKVKCKKCDYETCISEGLK